MGDGDEWQDDVGEEESEVGEYMMTESNDGHWLSGGTKGTLEGGGDMKSCQRTPWKFISSFTAAEGVHERLHATEEVVQGLTLGGIWEAEVDELHLGDRHGGLRGRGAQEWEGIRPFWREPFITRQVIWEM